MAHKKSSQPEVEGSESRNPLARSNSSSEGGRFNILRYNSLINGSGEESASIDWVLVWMISLIELPFVNSRACNKVVRSSRFVVTFSRVGLPRVER